ncbi:MAG: hypothetical protein QHH75_00835 [Bacillota bacterium]|nr:hypothetical protein [Bacillota bacterium]
MKKTFMVLIIVVGLSLGVCTLPGVFQKNNLSPPVSRTFASPENPFEVIDSFYRAFSENDWDYVQALTTPAFFRYLNESGLVSRWQIIKKQDPSIQYVMFLVLDSRIDPLKGEAWALGRVSWKSARRPLPDYTETVFLRLINGSWKIVQIRVHSSAEIVGNFYQAIQNADWQLFRALLTDRYWNRLEATGVISALIKERGQINNEVYVVFLVTNFAESDSRAWVEGDVIWRPLSKWQKEVNVKIFLVREPSGWKIDDIRGHWEQAK